MKKKELLTTGQKNKLIDLFCHRLARENPWLWAVDDILHAAVEQDPEDSISKFMRFNDPKMFEQILKDLERDSRRRRRSW